MDFFRTARTLVRSGIARPSRPDKMLGAGLAIARWGTGVVGGYAVAAARYPNDLAVADAHTGLTFRELDSRSTALAAAYADEGIGADVVVGLLGANSVAWVLAHLALLKTGCDVVLMNTAFADERTRGVLDREGVGYVVTDRALGIDGVTEVALADAVEMAAGAAGREPPLAGAGRVVVLTSGTTGTPKGAEREVPGASGLEVAAGLLDRLPMRARETTVLAAPLFHAWGLLHLSIGALLATTFVLPEVNAAATLDAVEQYAAPVLVTTPVLLRRLCDLPNVSRRAASLRLVATSGSALGADLATHAQDMLGDVVHSLYGSTEVGWATVATPADLRANPACAGRPTKGVVVRLVDDDGREVTGKGRIAVGSALGVATYTDGTGKRAWYGLVDTGDIGEWDDGRRLVVVGRADDMVVSGGENVYPGEVEAVLAEHAAVREVAVVGVPDAEFGQRLRAVVVARGNVTEAELREYARSRLSRFQVPREVAFVDSLPRNPAGKVLRNQLAD